MALRAVKDGEMPQEASRPRSVAVAARSGSKLNTLLALRDRIAKEIQNPDCPAREIASLSKRLMEVMGEIETVEAQDREREAKRTAGPRMVSASSDEEWTGV